MFIYQFEFSFKKTVAEKEDENEQKLSNVRNISVRKVAKEIRSIFTAGIQWPTAKVMKK